MCLLHQNIIVPYINCDGTIESLTSDVTKISGALQLTIDNVQNIPQFIEVYVDHALKEQEERIVYKIADKTYDIISEMMECNIRKEEFIKLLTDEMK